MISILIAAILMAVGIPGLRLISQNSQQRNAVSDIHSMLARVRTEVAARNRGVTVCASNDQETCSGAVNWEKGWIIFVDRNANGTIDAGNDNILQVHAALPSGITLRTLSAGAAADNKIIFNSAGLPNTAATFRFCDERGLTSLRAVIVGPSGMIRPVTDGKDHANADIVSCT
jgi:type IV fimbrial biogenesis protein FimT